MLTDYKTRQGVDDDDASLPDRLSNFFAHFEASKSTTRERAGPSTSVRPAFAINAADTRRTLTRVNPRKVTSPDNIPRHA